jgi:hypothetical protein
MGKTKIREILQAECQRAVESPYAPARSLGVEAICRAAYKMVMYCCLGDIVAGATPRLAILAQAVAGCGMDFPPFTHRFQTDRSSLPQTR